MTLSTEFSTTEAQQEAKQALTVLRDVQGSFNSATRLFEAHRRDIALALDETGLSADAAVRQSINETLTTAAAYEADGMYAVMPTWDLLLSRVARLTRPADHAQG